MHVRANNWLQLDSTPLVHCQQPWCKLHRHISHAKIFSSIAWCDAKEVPCSSATLIISQSPLNQIMHLSWQSAISAWWSRTLVCVVHVHPSLKRKNHSETCSFNHFISFSSCFLKFMQNLIHTHCSTLLIIMNVTHNTNTVVYMLCLHQDEWLQWAHTDFR
jgi:hypothetical protein